MSAGGNTEHMEASVTLFNVVGRETDVAVFMTGRNKFISKFFQDEFAKLRPKVAVIGV